MGSGRTDRMARMIGGATLVAMGVVTAAASAQTPDANAASPLTSSKEYTVLQERDDRLIAELPNRMIVIAQELPTAPVVSAQVWIKTGSIYEQEHVGAGLSHFLEHLLSGGTTTTTPEIESNAILGRIGAQTNAATSLDTVRYYINTTAEHTGTAIDRLSDWMRNSVITEAEYERERQVIQREFEHGMGDHNRIFWKATQQALYLAHPARHPTIGYIDEFMGVSRQEIIDFYRRMYVPNNMVFVVVGDVDRRAVVDRVVRRWSDVEPGPLPDLSFPVEPPITAPRKATARADIERPRLRLAFPGTRLGEPGDYELDVLAMILGQGESSRLIRSVRDEQGLVTHVSAYNWSTDWGEGFFGIDAEVARPEGSLEQVNKAILEEVSRLREELVSDEELARAKRKVLSGALQSYQTAEGVASQIARSVIGRGDPDYVQHYAEAVQELTKQQLREAAREYLKPNRVVEVWLLPLEEGQVVDVQRRPPAAPLDGDLEQEPFDLDNTVVLTELKRVLAERAGEAKQIEVEPLERFTLSNGLRVLVQRTTLVPAVSMQMFWKGGLLGDEPGREGVANAVASMMTRGTESRTAQQITTALEDLGAGLVVNAGNNTTYAQATALSEDWPEVLEIMADVVLNPSFPREEWSRMQPRLLAAIDRLDDRWSGELSRRFRQVYFGDHPWSQPPLGRHEVVQSLTPADLREYHGRHLGAAETVISVVGDVEPEAIRDALEDAFGGLPDVAPVAFDPPPTPQPTPRFVPFHTGKRTTAVRIGFGPGIERAHPDYAALRVLSRVVSDFPSGWLEQELRGKGRGLTYAAHAGFSTGLVKGEFSIIFNPSSGDALEALARVWQVVERAKAGPYDPADVERAKAKVLSNELLGTQTNSDRAMSLGLDELYGVGDPSNERLIEAVHAVDEATLRRIAQQYLQNPVVVFLSPPPPPSVPVKPVGDAGRQ